MSDDRALRRCMERVADWCEPIDGLFAEALMIRGLRFPLEAPIITRTLADLDPPEGILFPAAPRGGTRE